MRAIVEAASSGSSFRRARSGTVTPGSVPTGWSLRTAELEQKIPLARVGRPEEIAEAAVFLASERSGYITGECIRVDGGLAM